MDLRHLAWEKIGIFCLELFFGINIVLLDLWLFMQGHSLPLDRTSTSISSTPTPTGLTGVQSTPTPEASLSPIPQPPVTIQTASAIKEIFIPLGSGQTDAMDWTDIPGALGYVDSMSYIGIKKVVLEATVLIPNGNETAWIRFFNKTDGHPVWFSDMSWSGGTTQFLISQPFTLDAGNKLYQIQIKNQLPTVATVQNSRIHLTLQ